MVTAECGQWFRLTALPEGVKWNKTFDTTIMGCHPERSDLSSPVPAKAGVYNMILMINPSGQARRATHPPLADSE